jgi:hypothetical protein
MSGEFRRVHAAPCANDIAERSFIADIAASQLALRAGIRKALRAPRRRIPDCVGDGMRSRDKWPVRFEAMEMRKEMFELSNDERRFHRDLPGGGFVAIDVRRVKSIWRSPSFRGRVVVERRGAERRKGHQPPTIASACGATLESVVRQLLPAAQCNATIGAALLELEPRARVMR